MLPGYCGLSLDKDEGIVSLSDSGPIGWSVWASDSGASTHARHHRLADGRGGALVEGVPAGAHDEGDGVQLDPDPGGERGRVGAVHVEDAVGERSGWIDDDRTSAAIEACNPIPTPSAPDGITHRSLP